MTRLPGRFCFSRGLSILLPLALWVNEAASQNFTKDYPPLKSMRTLEVAEPGTAYAGATVVYTATSYQKKLAQTLRTHAQGWDWSEFNWTVFYDFYRGKLTCAEYLKAIRSGGFQALDSLADLLTNIGLYSNHDSALFNIFSVLDTYGNYLQSLTDSNSQIDSNHFYAWGNMNLLGQLRRAAARESTSVQLLQVPWDLAERLNRTNLIAIMHSFAGSLRWNLNVTRIQLNNSLADILAIVVYELDLAIITEPSEVEMVEPPTVNEVLGYFANESEKMLVLALLISHPFQICSSSYDNHQMLQQERGLHAAVARELSQLWQSAEADDTRDLLAQLAIQVFHLDILQPLQVQACPMPSPLATVASAASSSQSEVVCSKESKEYKSIRKHSDALVSSIKITPDATSALQTKMLQQRWIGLGDYPKARSMITLVLDKIEKGDKTAFRKFMGMITDIIGLDLVAKNIKRYYDHGE